MTKRRIFKEMTEGLEAMQGQREGTIAVQGGSGNVFADIGLPNPEERLQLPFGNSRSCGNISD